MMSQKKLNLLLTLIIIFMSIEVIKDYTEYFDNDLHSKDSPLNDITYSTPTQIDTQQGGMVADKIILGTLKSPDFKTATRGFQIGNDGIMEIGGIKYNKFFISSQFESLDGWTKTANVFNYPGYLEIYTTNVNNNNQNAYIPADDQNTLTPNKTKLPVIEFYGQVSGTTALTAYAGMGEMSSDNGVGFKFSQTATFATWYNDANVQQTTNLSITPTDLHLYRAEVNSDGLRWYVDGILKHTVAMASSAYTLSQGKMVKFDITTNSAAIVKMHIYRTLFYQNF